MPGPGLSILDLLAMQGQWRPNLRFQAGGASVGLSPESDSQKSIPVAVDQALLDAASATDIQSQLEKRFDPSFFGRMSDITGKGQAYGGRSIYNLLGLPGTDPSRFRAGLGSEYPSLERMSRMADFLGKREGLQQMGAAEFNQGRPTDPDFKRAVGMVPIFSQTPEQAQINLKESGDLMRERTAYLASRALQRGVPFQAIAGRLGGAAALQKLLFDYGYATPEQPAQPKQPINQQGGKPKKVYGR